MSKSELLNAELRQSLTQQILSRTGLEIRERDYKALSEKIYIRMRSLRLKSAEAYYQLLTASTLSSYEEWEQLMLLLTNNESYFFRDKEQFALLRNRILPELIERNRSSKTLYICSAGCSSGEEPYSLAILLQELIDDLDQWNLKILGIDINQDALKKAQKGIYSSWSFRSVDQEIKQRYFKLIDDRYHLDQQIRKMVTFQPVNLVERKLLCLNEIDLILCRNVFIYFGGNAIESVLNTFSQALKPQGYLITGHAELSGQNLSAFDIKVFPESLVYQRRATNFANLPSIPLQRSPIDSSVTDSSSNLDIDSLETAFKDNNARMKKVSLSLLKQLPHSTRIEKLGNLTIAELISQIEAEQTETE